MKSLLCILGFAILLTGVSLTTPHDGVADDSAASGLAAVEQDPHEFMEYAFEPFFRQLKNAMKSAPADRKGWVPIKANSLILAENGNLLMLRPPAEDATEWNRLSVELRKQGQLLYESAKQRDYTVARKNYETLVQKCNDCHHHFAEGEHLQEP